MDDRGRLGSGVYERAAVVQPRVLVGTLLILAGVVWAVARGLSFYGVTPPELGYDVDQPPVLLLLVAALLMYRGRSR